MKSGNASFTIEQPGASSFNQAHQFDGSTSIINQTESGNVAYFIKQLTCSRLNSKKTGLLK
ncbi:MAG: hypothetical protein JWO32_1707 [Bacteroidetes bacterium]|nr:hypothetical protein [Bacteroidota bacterium]